MNSSAYKSEQLKAKALDSYHHILSLWPVPYKERQVNTAYGHTYVLTSGKESKPPLILLHGGGGNSTMWFFNIAELSKHFCIHCVDIIGEAGKSDPTRPSIKSKGYSLWLADVLTALSLESSSICGASLGGVLTYQFALDYPKKVDSIVLAAPANLFTMRKKFIFNALTANLLPFDFMTKRFLHYMSSRSVQFDEQMINAFINQVRSYKPNKEFMTLSPISTEELNALPKKTLFMLGEDEVLYDLDLAISRVKTYAPQVTVELVSNAKHTIPSDEPDVFNKMVVDFCLEG